MFCENCKRRLTEEAETGFCSLDCRWSAELGDIGDVDTSTPPIWTIGEAPGLMSGRGKDWTRGTIANAIGIDDVDEARDKVETGENAMFIFHQGLSRSFCDRARQIVVSPPSERVKDAHHPTRLPHRT
mmetsp:Transcript_2755/g.5028  ORF Transcript_2755/g.5028 Transcript_2755/m.5028 type:complete len:128 (+) Transcript_2755:1196-1579(+)